MKSYRRTLPLTAALLAAAWGAQAAPPKAKAAAPPAKAAPAALQGMTVAFQTTGPRARYVTARPKGALEAIGGKDTPTFQLIDLNGAPLKNGDKVQIEFAPGGKGKPSFWRENKGKVTRMGGHPNATCVFVVTWKKPNASLTLKTASGKFVSAPAQGGALVTTAKASDPTAVFTLVKKG